MVTRRGGVPVGLVRVVALLIVLVAFGAFDPPALGAQPAHRSVLAPEMVLTSGHAMAEGDFRLTMRTDGDLTETLAEPNGQAYPVFATTTAGHPGAWATMQADGNFVIYAPAPGGQVALWATGTEGHPGARFELEAGGALEVTFAGQVLWSTAGDPAAASMPVKGGSSWRLWPGQGLYDGQVVTHGRYVLAMQDDGNLVIYRGPTPRWASGTVGDSGDWLVMQGDGNLVIYSDLGVALWASGTSGDPGASARLTASGSLTVALDGTTLWTTAAPRSVRYPPGATGYDISWPQCGSPYPPPATIGVVGMNDGSAFTTNPCSASEGAWAGQGLDAYMNINSPPYVNATDDEGPAGSCAPGDDDCLGFNFGYNAALQALGVASGEGLRPAMWWLDVETVGSCGRFPTKGRAYWSCNASANAATIQGALDALRATGQVAGVYCTDVQWGEITGSYVPTGGPLPNWVAGDTSSKPASWCSSPRTFGGGQIWLLQLWPPATYDQDLAC